MKTSSAAKKMCNECRVELTLENTWPSRRHTRMCKVCDGKRVNDWKKNNRDVVNTWEGRMRKKTRQEVLSAYGGHCACCGESNPAFLTVDHVFNDGAAHRKDSPHLRGGRAFYRWLLKNGCPKDRFQLLCMNCNFAKGKYGACPHTELSLVELVKSGKKLEFSATGTPAMVGA